MRRWLVVLVLALAVVVTGCDAPLAPESDREDASSGSTGSPTADDTASPSPAAPTGTPAPRGTRPVPIPSAPPEPAPTDVKVPEGLRAAKERVVLGGDASWPQCPKGMGIPQKRSQGSPMPLPQAEYVVLGLTNGPGFHANPCLAEQVAWVRSRHLMAAAYSIISWPEEQYLRQHARNGPYDGSTRLGALGNNGYQQARFNLATMARAGLSSPVVWLDVEPVPDFAWSSDTAANAAVVRGAERAYRELGHRTGFYSTPYLWRTVVGNLRLGLPEWRAAGQTSRKEALRRCAPDWSFQGGQAVLSQWVEAGRDQDVTCPGTSVAMATWFHQY